MALNTLPEDGHGNILRLESRKKQVFSFEQNLIIALKETHFYKVNVFFKWQYVFSESNDIWEIDFCEIFIAE